MKQSLVPDEARVRQILSAVAKRFGVAAFELSEAQAEGLVRLCRELASGATKLGLTNYASPAAVLDGLVAPAVAALAWLDSGAALDVVEIGAGSGALGLTLALLSPRWRVTLVDRREKACRFSEVLALRVGVSGIRVIQADARLPAPNGKRFDAAVFRSVGTPQADLEIATGWVKPGGITLVWTSAEKCRQLRDASGWVLEGRRVLLRPRRWAVVALRRQPYSAPTD